MSDGETFVLIAALAVSVYVWSRWYWRLFKGFSPDCPDSWRWVFAMVPALGLIALIVALRLWAPNNVRDVPVYIVLFSAVGVASLAGVTLVTSVVGLDPIADLLERRNPAVIQAMAGIWMGVVALNVGSNIGQGETIDTSLIPLLFNGLLYCGSIALLAAMTGIVHSATAERSWVAAIRFGGIALSISLPLARAAAGDWVSIGATLIDSIRAVPSVLIVLAIGWAIERWRPSGVLSSKAATWTDGVFAAAGIVVIGAVLAHFPFWQTH